ncbi:mesenchyme-specific cell surface glycoprotein-like [Gigantopelta aegis]|uniref:mesenchyme-specific cell surface glycoprotein-like n=1 Tax=Gigantopelta aegis TaxID=1735272 RepID=UPI001B88AB3E|nr:mesenchyme-specific cell surface glycoprotein-like [Gigantopelta aegis]
MTGVVSIRGTPYGQGDEFVDPPGQILLISFPDMHATGNFSDLVDVTTLDFTKFDTRTSELLSGGVRFVYKAGNNSLSNDLEPGSITTTPNSKVAYVVLQKNNAVAVVDLVTKSITNIYGLGVKDWSKLKMDASDEDGGIHLKSWPIYSYYLPNDLQYFRHGYRGYLVTANEGTSVNLTQEVGWSEVLKGYEFIERNLTGPMVSEEMMSWLANKADLGSLCFTSRNGEDTNDSFTKFVTFGGRSFSIWRTVDLRLVFDSGDDMETETAERIPDLFNAGTDADGTPRSQVDKQSTYRGPRPESVAVGRIGDLTVIFIGSGAPGSVFVYSVHKNVSSPKFESVWSSVGNTRNTWDELFGNRTLRVTDPRQLM